MDCEFILIITYRGEGARHYVLLLFTILNQITMEYLKTTLVIYPFRQSVFSSEFLELPCQSPLLGNTVKYTPSRASPIQTFPVLGQLYWAYILPYCPVEDSGVAALKFHLGYTLCLNRYITGVVFKYYILIGGHLPCLVINRLVAQLELQ